MSLIMEIATQNNINVNCYKICYFKNYLHFKHVRQVFTIIVIRVLKTIKFGILNSLRLVIS